MKKSIFVTIAFIAFTSMTNQLFAQDAAAKTSGYDLKKNVKCRVITTDTGCSIVFENEDASSRDVATGQSSGRRQHGTVKIVKEFSVSAADNAVEEVKSPRDAASGLATGKRQHKPITITKEIDKSSPVMGESMSGSGGESGKVNIQDITLTKRCGGKNTKLSVVDGECVVPTDDCPNGTCSLIASWSWGTSNSGSSSVGSGASSRCSVDFLLEIEDGTCTAMAINEKGLPGEKGTKATTKK
ncbi:MAG: type VI secretion system tube protein Hcp [Bacteroidota bacterium]